MINPNPQQFHQSISKTLSYLLKHGGFEFDTVFTVFLIWELIILKKLKDKNAWFTDFLHSIVNSITFEKVIHYNKDRLDPKMHNYLKENYILLLNIFEHIWRNDSTDKLTFWTLWKKECDILFVDEHTLESDCIMYLKMLNVHFGYDEANLANSVLIISYIQRSYELTRKDNS